MTWDLDTLRPEELEANQSREQPSNSQLKAALEHKTPNLCSPNPLEQHLRTVASMKCFAQAGAPKKL